MPLFGPALNTKRIWPLSTQVKLHYFPKTPAGALAYPCDLGNSNCEVQRKELKGERVCRSKFSSYGKFVN